MKVRGVKVSVSASARCECEVTEETRLFRDFFRPNPASILVACLLAVLIGSAAQRTRCTDCTVAGDNLHVAHLFRNCNAASLGTSTESHCVLCAGAPSPLLKTFVVHQAVKRGPANGVPPGLPLFLAVNGRLPPRPYRVVPPKTVPSNTKLQSTFKLVSQSCPR